MREMKVSSLVSVNTARRHRVHSRVLVAALIVGAAVSVDAQQSATPPAPGAKPSPSVTDTNAYPFQKALDVLNGKQANGPAVPSVSAARSTSASVASSPVVLQRIPADSAARGSGSAQYVGPRAVHVAELSPAEMKALAIANSMKSSDAMPAAGKEGRVTYTFGVGLPTVITSPLHVSIIELEPGETLSGEPTIGDSIRWEIMPGSSGSGAEIEPLVMLKPHEAGLDTNLVITTNKRTYYLRLVSRDSDYIARVAFSYKDDEDARWKSYLETQQRDKTAREDAQVVTPMASNAIDRLNFDYDIKGGDNVVRPIRVMDDGEKTYITMPDATLHQDLPALVVVNPRLKGEKAEEIVNYRVKGNLYIVDRLFDHAALVLGNGKSAQKVEIRRRVPLSGGSK
jgi:type IV secretion system protein TrbG